MSVENHYMVRPENSGLTLATFFNPRDASKFAMDKSRETWQQYCVEHKGQLVVTCYAALRKGEIRDRVFINNFLPITYCHNFGGF